MRRIRAGIEAGSLDAVVRQYCESDTGAAQVSVA
jgi:hypothetical protein